MSLDKKPLYSIRCGQQEFWPCAMYEGDNAEEVRDFLERRPDVLKAFVKDSEDPLSLDTPEESEYAEPVTFELWMDEGKVHITVEPMCIVSAKPGIENIHPSPEELHCLLPPSVQPSPAHFLYRTETFYKSLLKDYESYDFSFKMYSYDNLMGIVHRYFSNLRDMSTVSIAVRWNSTAVCPARYWGTDNDTIIPAEMHAYINPDSLLLNHPFHIVVESTTDSIFN